MLPPSPHCPPTPPRLSTPVPGFDRKLCYHDDQSPLAGARLPPRPTPASRRVAEIYPSPASNVSLTYSTSDDDHHAHDDGDVDARSATSSSNDNSYNTNTSTSPVQHVIGADPWGFGRNEQARTGGSDGEEKEECASADSSYEEVFTQVLEGIDMGVDSINSGLGMGTVIGKRVGDGGQEVITVGSTLALVSSAQAAVREQMDSLQRQVGEVDMRVLYSTRYQV